MTTTTICTTHGIFHFDTDEWGRDSTGDVHVYDGSDTLATFDADAFVGALHNLSNSDVEELSQKYGEVVNSADDGDLPGAIHTSTKDEHY